MKGVLTNFWLKEKLFDSLPDLLTLYQGDITRQTRTFLVCCCTTRKNVEESTSDLFIKCFKPQLEAY